MKKATTRLLVILLSLLLILPTTSLAVDLSKENCTSEALAHCNILTLNTNRYYGQRPLVIFFPGSNEVANLQSAIGFVRNYKLYDDLSIDLLVVTFKKGGNLWYKDFHTVCEEVMDFVYDQYYQLGEDEIFPIIIDAVSFGGYGGCYMAKLLMENGFFVDQLNIADGCSDYCVTPDLLSEIMDLGVYVNVWGCHSSGKISKATRNIIDQFDGSARFYGEILDSTHGAVLSIAIHDFNLHSEWSN